MQVAVGDQSQSKRTVYVVDRIVVALAEQNTRPTACWFHFHRAQWLKGGPTQAEWTAAVGAKGILDKRTRATRRRDILILDGAKCPGGEHQRGKLLGLRRRRVDPVTMRASSTGCGLKLAAGPGRSDSSAVNIDCSLRHVEACERDLQRRGTCRKLLS